MATPIPAVTGLPSNINIDPMTLIAEGRGQEPVRREFGEDEGFAKGAVKPATFYDPSVAAGYRQSRLTIDDVDYGAANEVVDAVRAQREALQTATRALAEAKEAVAPADARDAREAVVAAAEGRSYDATHGAGARRALATADMDSAVALHLAIQGERQLAAAIGEHRWSIRNGHQTAIDAIRSRLLNNVASIRADMAELNERERSLGRFEVQHVARSVPLDLEINMRPPDAPPGWRAPTESPHGKPIAALLGEGRELPRPPTHELSSIEAWATIVPWVSTWRPEVEQDDQPEPEPEVKRIRRKVDPSPS